MSVVRDASGQLVRDKDGNIDVEPVGTIAFDAAPTVSRPTPFPVGTVVLGTSGRPTRASVGALVLGPDGQWVQGPNGEKIFAGVGDLKLDLVHGMLVDANGDPLLGKHGEQLRSFGTPVLDPNGNLIRDAAGDPIFGPPMLAADRDTPLPAVYAEVQTKQDAYCQPLSPTTRLLLENMAFSVTGGYSNQAGFTNVAVPNPIIQTTANSNWAVGIGWSQKPILRQLRSLYEGDVEDRKATSRQGTMWEDFFWNAIQLNASISYGRQASVVNGTLAEAPNTRPFYSVTGTYQIDIERAYIHLVHPNARAVDPGYFYQPPAPGFFHSPDQPAPSFQSLGPLQIPRVPPP